MQTRPGTPNPHSPFWPGDFKLEGIPFPISAGNRESPRFRFGRKRVPWGGGPGILASESESLRAGRPSGAL
jgi:hypothetical protein